MRLVKKGTGTVVKGGERVNLMPLAVLIESSPFTCNTWNVEASDI